jgi:putative ABC transport system permease protein
MPSMPNEPDLTLAAPRAGRESRKRSHAAAWESILIAVDSVWSHKLRSVLTLLGIIIGVASVVAVGGAIEGLGTYVNEQLVTAFGSNSFMLARIARMNMSAEEFEKVIKRNKRVYVDDLRAVEAGCDGCEAVVPVLSRSDDAKAGGRTFYDASVTGSSADLTKLQELVIEEGRFFTGSDVDHSRSIAVIGADVRQELFGSVEAVGRELKIGGDAYVVAGVEKRNGTFLGQSRDINIYIPYTSYLKKYGYRQSLNIRIKAPSASSLVATEDEVRVIMRSRHKLKPNVDDDFDILASDAMQASVGQFTGAIAAVVTPITLISLVVGGIVIMNIMLVTVTERTQEIGMRKAIGARRADILLQFLVESSLLASAGGALGLILGYAVSVLIRNTTPIPMTITLGYIALSLLASGGIGLISGIYPAHKASKLDPIVALSRD